MGCSLPLLLDTYNSVVMKHAGKIADPSHIGHHLFQPHPKENSGQSKPIHQDTPTAFSSEQWHLLTTLDILHQTFFFTILLSYFLHAYY